MSDKVQPFIKAILLGMRHILREMPLNSLDFDEKEFWKRLGKKMNSDSRQGDYRLH